MSQKQSIKIKQVGLDLNSYNILLKYKDYLIDKYKETTTITFSDAIREMDRRIKKNEKKD